MQDRPGAQDYGPFNDVFQLPDVPGPRVILQRFQRLILNGCDLFSKFFGVSLCEGLDHQRDVCFPLAQRRDSDGKYVESIVKVLPKPAIADLFFKVSIGRRHDPHIDFDGMGRAEALKLVMLNHPEQLCLDIQRQFPDLVKAKGGTIGDLKPTDLPGIGPGKCPLLPAEQLALN